MNRLYMLLILLLMLSQDPGFVVAAQTAMLPSVPWYKDRLLGPISVGSLLVLVLVRTVQNNLAGVHDAYVHTNCLAALANVAPHLRKLHPHAARSLVSLNDVFARKFLKLSRREQARKQQEQDVAEAAQTPDATAGATAVQTDGGGADGGGADGGGRPSTRGDGAAAVDGDALQMSVDFLRIALEALNLCLTAGPAANEHLIYALLERQQVFQPLRGNELFADLLENVDLILEHFEAALRPKPEDDEGDPVWSVDAVLTQIRHAARDWRADRLRQLADLRFTYEQEPSPEEFFTPYLWEVVFETGGVPWKTQRLVLFPAGGGGFVEEEEEEDGSVTGDRLPIPALSEVNVDR